MTLERRQSYNLVDILSCILEPKIETIQKQSNYTIQYFQANMNKYKRSTRDINIEPLKYLEINTIRDEDSANVIAIKIVKHLMGSSFESQWRFIDVKYSALPQNADNPVYGRYMKILLKSCISPSQDVIICIRLYKHESDGNLRIHLQNRNCKSLERMLEVGCFYILGVKTVNDVPMERLLRSSAESAYTNPEISLSQRSSSNEAQKESILSGQGTGDSKIEGEEVDSDDFWQLEIMDNNTTGSVTDHSGKSSDNYTFTVENEDLSCKTASITPIERASSGSRTRRSKTGGWGARKFHRYNQGGNKQQCQSLARQSHGKENNSRSIKRHDDEKPIIFDTDVPIATEISYSENIVEYDDRTIDNENAETIKRMKEFKNMDLTLRNNTVVLRDVFCFRAFIVIAAIVVYYYLGGWPFSNTYIHLGNSTTAAGNSSTIFSNTTEEVSIQNLAKVVKAVRIESSNPEVAHKASPSRIDYYSRTTTMNSFITDAHTNIVLLGRTGDGKSASGNLMAKILCDVNGDKVIWQNDPVSGSTNNCKLITPFSESAGTDSHTVLPRGFRVIDTPGFRVIDTPGLMDSGGLEKDEENVVEIVKYLIREGFVNGFVLVVNEQAPRFDGPMQDAVKLLVDTFGPGMLHHMGILFTRSTHRTVEESVQYVKQHFVPALKAKTGYNIAFLPSWQVENHPEQLAGGLLGVSQETVDKFHARNKDSVKQLKNWASAKPALDVSNTKPAQYPLSTKMQQMLREMEFNNTINPDQTTGECREVEVSRSHEASRRYGPKCVLGVFGGRQFKDFWDDITYQRECRSVFIKNNGELHSTSPWKSSGDLIRKQENLISRSCC